MIENDNKSSKIFTKEFYILIVRNVIFIKFTSGNGGG